MEAESQDGGYCHGQTGFLETGTVRTALRQVTETEVTGDTMGWTGCRVRGKKRIQDT